MQQKTLNSFYKNVIRFALKTLYGVEIKGLDNYRKAGNRVLIVSNHVSFMDAVLLAAFLPDDCGFAINTHIAKKWWVKPFLKHIKHFPLDPTSPYATKGLIDIIKSNEKCVIFPEGRITVTGSLMKIYQGPGLIADRSGANILPVKIDGAIYSPFSRMGGKIKRRIFPKIKITILEPVKMEIDPDVKGRKRRKLAGQRLYEIMKHMVFVTGDFNKNLFNSLLDSAKINGMSHHIAEDINRTPITYRKLIMGSFILGGKFNKFTKRKEAVGLMLPNSNANLVSFFALLSRNRVPAMINYSNGSKNVISACKTALITTIVTSRTFIEKGKLDKIIENVEAAGVKITYLEDIRSKISLLEKTIAIFKSLFCSYFTAESHHLSPAVILFTSGSEGSPKAVVLSHRNINSNRFQLASVIDFNASDRVLNALPMFHSFGLTGATLLPILSGIKVFFYPSPLHYRIVPEMVYSTNSTIMFGTDTFLAGYARFAHPYDFYSVRYIFSGAEKLRDETRRLYSDKFGVRIFEGYGATETSPAISLNTPMYNKAGTVGKILPGISTRLEAVDGIDDGGKLIVSGPNVMLGYMFEDRPGILVPPLNAEYDTGDIVNINTDGYVKILGRLKRFAKIAGEMISLTAVENHISELWPDVNNAVITIPDERKGEQLVLYTEKANATRANISEYFRQHGLSELLVPKTIVSLEKLPMLGTGKVDYVKLKDINEQQNNV